MRAGAARMALSWASCTVAVPERHTRCHGPRLLLDGSGPVSRWHPLLEALPSEARGPSPSHPRTRAVRGNPPFRAQVSGLIYHPEMRPFCQFQLLHSHYSVIEPTALFCKSTPTRHWIKEIELLQIKWCKMSLSCGGGH